ncbi:MAG: hypothetical protein H6909_03085 [Rickettsiaceae bacterium]|nr:hypothetical protein [Rickettsiaceae bacterium]
MSKQGNDNGSDFSNLIAKDLEALSEFQNKVSKLNADQQAILGACFQLDKTVTETKDTRNSLGTHKTKLDNMYQQYSDNAELYVKDMDKDRVKSISDLNYQRVTLIAENTTLDTKRKQLKQQLEQEKKFLETKQNQLKQQLEQEKKQLEAEKTNLIQELENTITKNIKSVKNLTTQTKPIQDLVIAKLNLASKALKNNKFDEVKETLKFVLDTVSPEGQEPKLPAYKASDAYRNLVMYEFKILDIQNKQQEIQKFQDTIQSKIESQTQEITEAIKTKRQEITDCQEKISKNQEQHREIFKQIKAKNDEIDKERGKFLEIVNEGSTVINKLYKTATQIVNSNQNHINAKDDKIKTKVGNVIEPISIANQIHENQIHEMNKVFTPVMNITQTLGNFGKLQTNTNNLQNTLPVVQKEPVMPSKTPTPNSQGNKGNWRERIKGQAVAVKNKIKNKWNNLRGR